MARKIAALALLTAAAAGSAAFLKRQRRPAEHVDVYGADGSIVSFRPGTPAGDRLLPIARRVLAAARR